MNSGEVHGNLRGVPALPEKVSLDEIVRILVDQYGPIETIILFGSYARGDTDEYSDLDLILVKETSKQFVERLGRSEERRVGKECRL